jgi:hypothetical protein
MSLNITSVGTTPVLPAENTPTAISHPVAAKVAAPPPPPPPPPPPKDTVQLSLEGSIKELQSVGDTPEQIAQTLGVSVQTVSIDLGTSFIEATFAAAPTLPTSPTAT